MIDAKPERKERNVSCRQFPTNNCARKGNKDVSVFNLHLAFCNFHGYSDIAVINSMN